MKPAHVFGFMFTLFLGVAVLAIFIGAAALLLDALRAILGRTQAASITTAALIGALAAMLLGAMLRNARRAR